MIFIHLLNVRPGVEKTAGEIKDRLRRVNQTL